MACFPDDPNGYCPNGQGSISELYDSHGGMGDECGYIQFPTDPIPETMPAGVIAAIAITPVVLVIVLGMLYHNYQLKEQEKRMKKRFIQQLARNIDIGTSALQISAAKLSETFEHIGGQDGLISKIDLAQWMCDLNLDFLSERDFDRLWETMDMDRTGFVKPIEFFQFLSECEKQIEEVHSEYSSLPTSEKRKLCTRRLTNYRNFGREEVERMERRNKRRNRQMILPQSAPKEPRDSGTCATMDDSSKMDGSSNLDHSSKRRLMSDKSLNFQFSPSPNNSGSHPSKSPFSESTLKRIEEAFVVKDPTDLANGNRQEEELAESAGAVEEDGAAEEPARDSLGYVVGYTVSEDQMNVTDVDDVGRNIESNTAVSSEP